MHKFVLISILVIESSGTFTRQIIFLIAQPLFLSYKYIALVFLFAPKKRISGHQASG